MSGENTETQTTESPQIVTVREQQELDLKAASESDSAEVVEETPEDSETSEDKVSEESEKDDSEGDEETEDSDDDEDGDGEPKKAAKKSGFAKRIAKLKAKQAEAEREAEYWKSKALRGDEADTSGESKETMPSEDIPNPYLRDVGEKPDPDDYESQDEYLDALTDWKIDVREAKKQFEADQTKAKTAAQKQAETFHSRVQEYSSTVEDWDETLESVSDIQMNSNLMRAIMTSEFAPHLMYDLSKNRSELERINQMDPASTLKAIGKLEAKFEGQQQSSSSKQETKTTKAPPPPSPVGKKSGKATAKSIYDRDLSYKEYEKLREQQQRASS